MIFLFPAALAGLVALAAPIAIHILAKRRAARIPFPTLRFIQPGRLVSVRRHVLEDAALLAVRLSILAAAAMALAGPLVVTGGRKSAWNARTQTAVVEGDDLSAGIRHAALELLVAAPGRREIVVRSTFPIGSLRRNDILAVPGDYGLRFERMPAPPPSRTVELPPVLTDSGERSRTMTVDRGTTVREGAAIGRASPSDGLDALDALTAAVVSQRVLAPISGRTARVVSIGGADVEAAIASASPMRDAWMADGVAAMALDTDVRAAAKTATEALDDSRLLQSPWIVVASGARGRPLASAASVQGSLTVVSAAPPAALVSALLLRAAMNAAGDGRARADAEVLTIPDSQLQEWTRAPGPAPPPRIETVEHDDRRWFWIGALVLLAMEWWLRSRARSSGADARGAMVAGEGLREDPRVA